MDETLRPPKLSVDIKQTAKGFWYVGSLKVDAENIEELDNLLSESSAKVLVRISSLNGEGIPQPEKETKEMKEEFILTPAEMKVFQNLKELRIILAKQESMPPYIIFHDSVLKRVAKVDSLDKTKLLQTIGEKKFSKYGVLILELLEKHKPL